MRLVVVVAIVLLGCAHHTAPGHIAPKVCTTVWQWHTVYIADGIGAIQVPVSTKVCQPRSNGIQPTP